MTIIEELKKWLNTEHYAEALASVRCGGGMSYTCRGASQAYEKCLKRIKELETKEKELK